jgi:acyl carrier protein
VSDTRERLLRCMQAVFPSVPENQLELAQASGVDGWDSVASVTLFATIEEEFGIEIDVQDMKDLLSFEKLAAYLEHSANEPPS